MAVFTSIAAAVTAAISSITLGSVAAFAARTLFAIGVSKLLANRANKKASGTSSVGARVQLPPATNNKLPIVYGTAYVAPVITDAKISTDQKTMWYVCALSEVTDTGTISFDEIYWGGKQATFDGTDLTKVVSLTNNAGEVDTRVSGFMYMYFYRDGSDVPTNTTAQAWSNTVLSDPQIPAGQRWTPDHSMFKTAFVVIKVIYNQDAGLTGLDQITVKLTNSLKLPGSVIYDYMTNTRYGCAIPPANIDTSSLVGVGSLDDYSNDLITYVPVGGGSATQERYNINGPIDTGTNCLSNLQYLVDSCDSWLQYSELTGQWRVVVNSAVDTTNSYVINSDNLVSGIDINPIDLNETYTSVEVQYPNINIRDQMAFATVYLIDYVPQVMSPNEANNQLVIQLPLVNNAVQAQYLGVRRLLQSREDLTISCALDYSGIVLEAGDVVKITLAEYGWTEKLFRISQVQEVKDENGNLGVRISGFEYNATIYNDNAIQDFIPADNTGLSDPNIISEPTGLTITNNPDSDGNIASFTVSIVSPAVGSVLYLDFNFGTSSDPSTHRLYRTVSTGNGIPYAPSTTVSIVVNDLPPNTYYWSVTARNNSAGRQGGVGGFVWTGMNVTLFNPITGTGGIPTAQLQYGAVTNNIVAANAINTTNVVLNAITIPGGSYTAASKSIVPVTDDIAQTVTILSAAAPIIINGSFYWVETAGISGASPATVALYRNNTLIYESTIGESLTTSGSSLNGNFAFTILDQPPAGSTSYDLKVLIGLGDNYVVQFRTLTALEAKR
jgi:hypothetical protein